MATIGQVHGRKFLKSCYLSALFGASAGFMYKYVKNEPKKLKKILGYATTAGGAGCILGALYGYNRKRNLFPSALKGTAKFFIISGTFLGMKEAIVSSEVVKSQVGQSKKLRFAEMFTVGAVTGFLIGSAWSNNPLTFLVVAAGTGSLSATGQFINDKIYNWRLKKAILLKYPELLELEWEAMDKEEQDIVRKKQQSWFTWAIERLLDRPYIGKLKLKHQALYEEILALETEEHELRIKLGLVEREENDFDSFKEDNVG
ncbi:uncharacterized protein LOC135682520 [Rhopilema esculentum]|uniref:uncharacterized protein LOC135682520 n=1 Tax=Rhopilema esculentum TaxID=499914 RepID=UPI0031CF09B6